MSELKSASSQIEPIVGTLRLAEGTRRDAATCAATLTPPSWAARGREGEQLFVLLHLTGPAPSRLYREMREVIAQTYWSAGGSITAALRQATAAANRLLFQFNLDVAPSERCYGGLTCAVLRGEDFFILVGGPACACILHQGYLDSFPCDEELSHLGMGRLSDVRLHHTFADVGDTLLLASPALVQAAGRAGLARVLPRTEVKEVVAGLEQVGAGTDFIALVGRLTLSSEAPQAVESPGAVPQAEIPAIRKPSGPSLRERLSERLRRARPAKRPDRGKPVIPLRGRRVEPSLRTVEPREPPSLKPKPEPRPKPTRTGPSLGERVKDSARTVGHGIAAAAVGLARGTRTLFRRMLPGAEREARLRARPRRELPKENRTVMMAIAASILILVVIIVVLAHSTFGEAERFESLMSQVEREAALAQVAGDTAQARAHWEEVLKLADKASEMQRDNTDVIALQAQAKTALDELDNVVRLEPVLLGSLGKGDVPRRLVIHGQSAFVLDPTAGWVSKLSVSPAGDNSAEMSSTLVRTGDQVSGGTVGPLIDFAWVKPESGRLTSGLVILEEGGVLLTYDPAWGSESGAPQLTRTFLGTPPAGTPKAVGSFEGRFYVLDVTASQIWRYEPRGDAYPDQPNRYFTDPSSASLGNAVDMAIDGHIYILYADGTLSKFLRGDPAPFEVRGVPDGFDWPVALAVDPETSSGVVYVADRGNQRVVVLGPDGTFRVQFRAEGAFDELEALVVDEAAGRMYVFSGGRLYVASLPALP